MTSNLEQAISSCQQAMAALTGDDEQAKQDAISTAQQLLQNPYLTYPNKAKLAMRLQSMGVATN